MRATCPAHIILFDVIILIILFMQLPAISYYVICGVRLRPLGIATTTDLLYQPQMIDDGDCGAIGGIKIGRGNRSIVILVVGTSYSYLSKRYP
jgi:uncharacterized membrane-anchored protein